MDVDRHHDFTKTLDEYKCLSVIGGIAEIADATENTCNQPIGNLQARSFNYRFAPLLPSF